MFQLFRENDCEHYLEILKILLSLSEKNQLDPSLWLDLLNTVTKSPGKFSIQYQTREERLEAITDCVAADTEEVNLQETANVIAELQLHFHTERLHFGLYGLYPKYRPYVEALAGYFSLVCLKIISGQVKLDQGVLVSDHLESVWSTVERLYSPWLFPLSSTDRQSAATWIQQLTNENALLPPWIPGDCGLASSMLHSFLTCVQSMMSHDQSSRVLSKLWTMYAGESQPITTNQNTIYTINKIFFDQSIKYYLRSLGSVRGEGSCVWCGSPGVVITGLEHLLTQHH